MEHLALEIFDLKTKDNPNLSGSKYANLPEDASITITGTSEIFGSGDVWSHSFTLNVFDNAHIFGTAGDIHGSRLHEQINKRRARLWVMGLPLYLGYLKLDDQAEVDGEGNIDVSLESGQKTFDEKIEGAKANQVPMMSDVRIGMALWRKRWVSFGLKLTASVTTINDEMSVPADVLDNGNERINFTCDGELEGNSLQQYPRMVFPKGTFVNKKTNVAETINDLNTDYPYDDRHPYCNIPLCYQRYGYEKKDQNGNIHPEYNSEPEAQRGYEEMPANRVNSAPCFYVIYWLRSLMKHLGIHVEENQMMDVEDLRRLFFVNTKCVYDEPDYLRTVAYNERYGKFGFSEAGRLVPEYIMLCTKKFFIFDVREQYEPLVKIEDSQLVCNSYQSESHDIKSVNVTISGIAGLTEEERNSYNENNSLLHYAYATSECFPDVEISEVISAIENGFGVRLLFDRDYRRVRIVLLRNLFRNTEVQDVICEITGDGKEENCIRGFRMTYGDSDDTHFYYKGFADKLPHKPELWVDDSDKHDYSHWKLNADYSKIINKVSAFDKTCYVTPNTGNAYGIKIDKDAKRYDELHPATFELAGFMDAEDGDCTGEDNTIETIEMGFTPAVMNDLNMEAERKGTLKQKFALFVDETMRPRRPDLGDLQAPASYNDADAVYDVNGKLYKRDILTGELVNEGMTSEDGIIKPGEFAITSDMFASTSGLNVTTLLGARFVKVHFSVDGHINEGYRLYLQDNYEPNDDGVSPIEKHDWGLTLGIMRGSGSDAYVDYQADARESEGNKTWEIVPGSSTTAHPDTCDSYGNEWDYNGGGSRTSVTVNTAEEAVAQLQAQFPNSNAPFSNSAGYISDAMCFPIEDLYGTTHNILFVVKRSNSDYQFLTQDYTAWLRGTNGNRHSVAEIRNMDSGPSGENLIVEIDSNNGRRETLLSLCEKAYVNNAPAVIIDNGIGSRYGRFSLKLRAEKLNPYFDPKQQENATTNRRYLEITDKNLRQRGLCDQFYKEYSHWVRNARIAKRKVRMEFAQLLAIDKTKRVRVGDVTGFIRKMQYTVSAKTGLGEVTLEIMYI